MTAGDRIYLYRDGCTECLRALDWLCDHGFDVEERDLESDIPSETEIERLSQAEGSLRDIVAPRFREDVEEMNEQDLAGYLSTDPERFAHPVALVGNRIFVGFSRSLRTALS